MYYIFLVPIFCDGETISGHVFAGVHQEMPHFAQEALVSRYGREESLTFVYYLKQARPCFAFIAFFADELAKSSGPSISASRWLQILVSLSLPPSARSPVLLYLSHTVGLIMNLSHWLLNQLRVTHHFKLRHIILVVAQLQKTHAVFLSK